jgi:hypothetical protein
VRRHGRQDWLAGIAVSNGEREWQASLGGQEKQIGLAGRNGG